MSYLITTATVLGFFVMFVGIITLSLVSTIWHEEWVYRRNQKRKNDLKRDNFDSKWLDEHITIQRSDTVERSAVHPDLINTVEIPRITPDVMDQTIDQIVNYQKEHHRDAS